MAIKTPEMAEVKALRAILDDFINKRKEEKQKKEKDEEKREKLEENYQRDTWIASAAARAPQLQLVTHALKFSHPDAKGSSLNAKPAFVTTDDLVSTQSLGDNYSLDAVGNAAALDVYAFLILAHKGKTLLDMILANDATALYALADDLEQGKALAEAFKVVIIPPSIPSTNKFSRQVYFPLPDGTYHILAPLFPTSLVQSAYDIMRQDKETAWEPRKARREGTLTLDGYKEYPQCTIQHFGGTKPQNISKLNSTRHGENWLLPSFPPSWKTAEIKPPVGRTSFFSRGLGLRGNIGDMVQNLRHSLHKTTYTNFAIRQGRAQRVAGIVDAIMNYAGRIQQLPPGWSATASCRLAKAQQAWLDPYRATHDAEFAQYRSTLEWQNLVARSFALWLNAALQINDQSAYAEWKAEFLDMLKATTEEVFYEQ